jgi:hypothetical protein
MGVNNLWKREITDKGFEFAPPKEISPQRLVIHELNRRCFSGCRPIFSCRKNLARLMFFMGFPANIGQKSE